MSLTVLRGAWWTALGGLCVVPLISALRSSVDGPLPAGPAATLALLTGVPASSLLIAAVVLPSRLTYLTRAFGIERILRGHRRFALATLLLVLAHVAGAPPHPTPGVR